MLRSALRFEQLFRHPVQNICRTIANSSQQPDYGICVDIDGVLARGYTPLPHAVETIQHIHDKVPLAFVTNALSRDAYKAYQLGEWFGVKIQSEQMVQAQGPLAMYEHFHHKHCLLVGQGPLNGIAEDIGFTKTHWMEDLVLAYPLLNVVDHQKRYEVDTKDRKDLKEHNFPRIEAIILLGEPKQWETCLQLIVDLLLTAGYPSETSRSYQRQTLPVVVCNVDLQYMHHAAFPRYGHGAFVLCLETLFEKITGKKLQYTAVLGKPSEITFRFAEHCLSKTAQRMAIQHPLKTMYVIGDNADVDILGANLYQHYINNKQNIDLPTSRRPLETANILPQTIRTVKSILVRTGVSQEESASKQSDIVNHAHREFIFDGLDMKKPTVIVDNILQAIEYIELEENM